MEDSRLSCDSPTRHRSVNTLGTTTLNDLNVSIALNLNLSKYFGDIFFQKVPRSCLYKIKHNCRFYLFFSLLYKISIEVTGLPKDPLHIDYQIQLELKRQSRCFVYNVIKYISELNIYCPIYNIRP